MKNEKDPHFSPEDRLRAENHLLQLKLNLMHGMKLQATPGDLDPLTENAWLKSVYEFEQRFANAKPAKVYDFVGRPSFRKWDVLSPDETSVELERIRTIMSEKGVELDCICSYDDRVIYKFITEELFEHEMDDMRIAGMTQHFIYEEFHPNHDHDLRTQAGQMVSLIFGKSWSEAFHLHLLAPAVTLSGKQYDAAEISAIIELFQDCHSKLNCKSCDVTGMYINPGLTDASVRGSLVASGKTKYGESVRFVGEWSFRFTRMTEYWYITELNVPGLSREEGLKI